MKLLAIEAVQYGSYFHSRYQQVLDYGAEVYLLAGCAQADHWRADHFRVANSKRVDDMVALARAWHDGEHFDGVITFSETSVVVTAAIAQALKLPGISPDAARRSRNKLFMRQAHERGRAPHPRFRFVETLEDALGAAHDFGYPVVLKPTLGAASSFVFRVDSPDELRQRYGQARAGIQDMVFVALEADDDALGPNGLLIESFLDGREYLIEAFAWDGEVVLGSIVDRVTVEGTTFDDDVHRAPTALDAAAVERVRQAVERGANAQGLVRSVMHAEVRFHRDEPYLLEIAARPGGGGLDHMARLSAGYCPIRAVMDIATGQRPGHVRFQPNSLHTAAMVLLCATGKVKTVGVPDELRDDPALFFFKVTAKPGDVILRPPLGNNILGFLGAKGASFDDALSIATSAAERIRVELEPLTAEA
jgi:biotin carboxylase